MYIPDNYDIFEQHEREVERKLKNLPVCRKCGEPITSEYAYDIDGLWCEDCFEDFKNDIRVDMDWYEGE